MRLKGTIRRKTRVQMPPRIARIIPVWEPDHESAQARPRNPPPHANNLVERGMQPFVIYCLTKWLSREVAQTNYRTSPSFLIDRIETCFAPENLARIGRGLSRKCTLQFQEASVHELLSLRIAQKATRRLFR